MHYKNIILHLSLIHNVGSAIIHKIVQQLKIDNLVDLYHFTQDEVMRLGLSAERARSIVEGLQDKKLLEAELAAIQEVHAGFITPWCKQYSELLRNIHVPPAVLYYQGDISLLQSQKMIACVGARKAHTYVQDCLNKIVVPMIQDDWVVVSGGAIGADTYAHTTVLEHGGKTIVVIGGGLFHCYPSRNKKLFQQVIANGGLVISSFPVKMDPEARCFPMRNRIISGLSRGCIVLQAASKSGALITAQFALEQGREVFAVPGPIYDPLSAGCHDLIKQGAKLVVSSEDVLEEVGMACFEDRQQSVLDEAPDLKAQPDLSQEQVSEYDDLEMLILQHTVVPISLGDLMRKVGVEQSVLHDKLFSLSLDGKVKQDSVGLFTRL